MKNLKLIFVGALILAVSQARLGFAAVETYTIDPTHSTLGFAVKHMAVGVTRGGFDVYSGSISFDPQDEKSFNAAVTIQVSSIDTKIADRDTHLKAPDFFDADKFPTIVFNSTGLVKKSEGEYDLLGNLTIKDVTKQISIPVSISGPVTSPFGAQVIGLSGELTINRKDYNVTFNKLLDNGGLMVDDLVKIIVEFEADKK